MAPSTIIGKSSDVFLFVPVKKNMGLLTSLFNEDKYMTKALDKTDYLYVSLKLKNKFKKGAEEREQLESSTEGEEEKIEDAQENVFEESQVNTLQNEIESTSTEGVFNEKNINETNSTYEPIKEYTLQEVEIKDIDEKGDNVFEEEEKGNLYINTQISDEIDEGGDVFDDINYEICAIGKYPKSVAGFIFSKKNGWKKEKSSGGYIYFQKNSSAEGGDLHSFFSIPTKNIALFSHNSSDECRMENLIDRLNSPRPSPFGIDFELAMQQGDDSSNICIFVANPHFFLSKLIGIDLDLPIENLKVYLNRNTERAKEFYNYTVILEVQNVSAGFATRLLLSKLLKSQVRIEENKIIVEKAKITKDRLLEIIKRVVFK